jgi:hypothetical protein
LLAQQRDGNKIRDQIDINLLKLLGLDYAEAKVASHKIQRGALAAIQMLEKTME